MRSNTVAQNTDKTTEILNRICRIERKALYIGMSEAMARAVRRYWRAFHLCAPMRAY